MMIRLRLLGGAGLLALVGLVLGNLENFAYRGTRAFADTSDTSVTRVNMAFTINNMGYTETCG